MDFSNLSYTVDSINKLTEIINVSTSNDEISLSISLSVIFLDDCLSGITYARFPFPFMVLIASGP